MVMTDEVISIAAPAIKQHEGLRLTAYRCSAGKLTIGYGHVLRTGEPHAITRARAEELLKQDMQTALQSAMTISGLQPQQYAALTSLIFNIGTGAFRTSTLRKRLNDSPRNDEKIFSEWRRWNIADGKVDRGLVNRREKEIQLYKGTTP